MGEGKGMMVTLYCIIHIVDSSTGLESLIAGVSNDKEHKKKRTLVNAGGGGVSVTYGGNCGKTFADGCF